MGEWGGELVWTRLLCVCAWSSWGDDDDDCHYYHAVLVACVRDGMRRGYKYPLLLSLSFLLHTSLTVRLGF